MRAQHAKTISLADFACLQAQALCHLTLQVEQDYAPILCLVAEPVSMRHNLKGDSYFAFVVAGRPHQFCPRLDMFTGS